VVVGPNDGMEARQARNEGCWNPNALCKPKALRHGFAVDAGQNGVSLNIVQRWLGQARIETAAIYASAIGEEKRNPARRAGVCWN